MWWEGRDFSPNGVCSKEVRAFFRTVEVDEFRTSSVCPSCGEFLQKVNKVITKDGRNVVREVRCLRRCNSQRCSQVSFKNHDSVGAHNIVLCLNGGKDQRN